MRTQARRRHALRSGFLGLSRRAARPLDRKLHQFILGLVPPEDGIPIPGIMGFIGCYFRQLMHMRPVGTSHAVAIETARRHRALRDTA